MTAILALLVASCATTRTGPEWLALDEAGELFAQVSGHSSQILEEEAGRALVDSSGSFVQTRRTRWGNTLRTHDGVTSGSDELPRVWSAEVVQFAQEYKDDPVRCVGTPEWVLAEWGCTCGGDGGASSEGVQRQFVFGEDVLTLSEAEELFARVSGHDGWFLTRPGGGVTVVRDFFGRADVEKRARGYGRVPWQCRGPARQFPCKCGGDGITAEAAAALGHVHDPVDGHPVMSWQVTREGREVTLLSSTELAYLRRHDTLLWREREHGPFSHVIPHSRRSKNQDD